VTEDITTLAAKFAQKEGQQAVHYLLMNRLSQQNSPQDLVRIRITQRMSGYLKITLVTLSLIIETEKDM